MHLLINNTRKYVEIDLFYVRVDTNERREWNQSRCIYTYLRLCHEWEVKLQLLYSSDLLFEGGRTIPNGIDITHTHSQLENWNEMCWCRKSALDKAYCCCVHVCVCMAFCLSHAFFSTFIRLSLFLLCIWCRLFISLEQCGIAWYLLRIFTIAILIGSTRKIGSCERFKALSTLSYTLRTMLCPSMYVCILFSWNSNRLRFRIDCTLYVMIHIQHPKCKWSPYSLSTLPEKENPKQTAHISRLKSQKFWFANVSSAQLPWINFWPSISILFLLHSVCLRLRIKYKEAAKRCSKCLIQPE